ncbi:helix-turn-helix transcriptional regulator [Vibrio natriegens]|uniref:helix-turn-helix transcriptional regulator n=1 Tax=Vibrio natriegens TaxID=691 RepID=UPI000804681B|nr:AraC family transcriptional regulator [Vibrio natriegens]ANQ19249.1 AraC family transcriptional regulator [Vibrio natriegens]
MQVGRPKRTKLDKISMTQILQDTEKQLIVTHGQPCQLPLAEGVFLTYQYNDQIFVHGGRCVELVNSNIVSTAQSSLLITILLEGKLSFGYDDLQFNLDATKSPKGVVVNLLQPANFFRSLVKDNHVNKINFLVKPQWLAQRLNDSCETSNFFHSHEAFYSLEVCPMLTELVSTLLRSGTPRNLQTKIGIESLIYQILSNVLQQMPNIHYSQHKSVTSRKDHKIEDIINYIETHLAEELSLAKLSTVFSMSVSNLQRRFKQSFNMTVNGYIRYRRLVVARQHLERGLVTITEAAYEAGYHHPSNFTNAFKKAFGMPPHEVAKV